jgi:hypothetical protein
MAQTDKGLEWQVVLGIIGFFLAGGLSLASGNEMITSLTRGAIGMFGFFLLTYLIRIALRVFVGTVDPLPDPRGTQIDLTAGDETSVPMGADLSGAGEDSEFVPLFQMTNATQDAFKDIDPQKLAEALRHLDE